jgi:hypothetical protein
VEGQAVLDPTKEPVQWYWLHFPRRPRKLERDVDNSSVFSAERSVYFEALSPPPHDCPHEGRMLDVHSSWTYINKGGAEPEVRCDRFDLDTLVE